MKIYMNKYRSHWLSPYTILTKVLFWEDEDEIYGLKRKQVGDGVYMSGIDWLKSNGDDRYEDTKPYIVFLLKVLEPISNVLMKILDKVHPKIDYVKIDPWDTWSMDHTLAQIILPMLKQLKATKHGVPADFVRGKDGKEIPFKRAERMWDNTLDRMIWSFEQIVDEENDEQFHTGGKYNAKAHIKHQAKIQEGLDLFGKHFRSLWD